jgi:ubiquinone biosynthesis O-methyltransferase
MNYDDYWKTWTDPKEQFKDWKSMIRVYPRLEWIDRELKSHKYKTVLDVGCGQGNLTIPLSCRGYKMTGLDISDYIIKIARQKSKEYQVKIKWCASDIFDHKGKYDAIIATHFMEHIDDLESILKKLVSLTKPGGMMFFTFPTKNHGELDHKRVFDINSILDLFGKNNLFYTNFLLNELSKDILWVSTLTNTKS